MKLVASARVVGRDAELIRMAAWARELKAGRGVAVLVEGEPGIGKSTLVRRACDRAAEDGCRVLWGGGDELAMPLLLSPLLEALTIRATVDDPHRKAIAQLLNGVSAARSSNELITAIAEQMIALVSDLAFATPTILVLDDLQWCDPATLAVWGRLARLAGELPLLLLGTVRLPPRDRRVLALERTVEPGARLRLGPLAQQPVAELVGDLCGGIPDQQLLELAAGAGGNPLYITELLAALDRSGGLYSTGPNRVGVQDSSVPKSLTAALVARLGGLTADMRRVLHLAAILGADFSVADLAIVSGCTPEQLDAALNEAMDVGILTGSDPAFRHPLLRSALYQDLSPELRFAWHRDAAAALADARVSPERVARQLLPTIPDNDAEEPAGAGDSAPVLPDWVPRWFVDAVPVLLARAPETAVRLLRAVLQQLPNAPQRDELAARLAAALVWTGATVEAEQVARRYLGSAPAPAPDAMVALLYTISQCHITTGRPAESLPLVSEALQRADLGATHRARLLAIQARLHHHLGKIDAARRIAEQALAEADTAQDGWATGWALHVLSVTALIRGEVSRSLPMFERALNVTQREPELADLQLLLSINHSVALGNLDRYEEAITAARHVCELAERTGSARQAQVQTVLGELLLDTGRWDDALLAVTAVPDDLKDPAGACCDLGVAAVISFHRGDARAGREYLVAAQRPAELVGGRVVRSLALAISLDAESSGDPTHALDTLLAGLSRDAEELEEIEGLLPDAVRIAVELGQLDRAHEVSAHVERVAATGETPHCAADVLYCRGLLAADASLLLAAEDAYQQMGRVLARAAAARAAGEVLATAGDLPQARRAFAHALEVYEDLDARWDLAGLRARMRQLGIRRSPHASQRLPREGWEGLTPSEVRVVDLVVRGLSNSQIGAELFLSPRTVETHVSHVLAKLGVRSRIDIVREASRRGSVG
jgi:DNA-binding NarL/FixJ family response regulator